MRLETTHCDRTLSEVMLEDALMKYVIERYMNEDQRRCVNERVRNRLREACRETKHKFSVKTTRVANLHVELSGGLDFTCRLTRARYESAIRKCVVKICDRAVEMIGSKSSSSSVVVLIGDSATDLYLQDEMRKRFCEIKISDRPDECVVRGAATQARYLNENKLISRRIVGVRLDDRYVSKIAFERLEPVSVIMSNVDGNTFEMFENNRTVVARRKKVNGVVKVNVVDDEVTVSFADESSSTIRMKFRNLDRSNIMEWNDKDGEGSSSKDDDDDDDDDVVVLDEDDMMMDMD